ncbi:aminotransferase class I/II-fold pyridoxal phosphate-dependent enzyme [Rhodoferax sp.]|uniref:aminotransferase class I/II-fold pyridoxal phosphate-dependent enzyme n=1 Tax=Rhodoferax sp. TaxID=50421 RepID=UPI002767884A|nr:aminotransferase class I/II-fold pyridoxal phosphate-dependent enzyme [Rhodoferax sp.]
MSDLSDSLGHLAPQAARRHGGPDALGAAQFDFSTNANACGPCPQALRAVREADVTRYPDPSYAALRAELAVFHGVDVQRVVLASSASEFIFRLSNWVAQQGGRTVQVPEHGYGDYAQAASAFGMDVIAPVCPHPSASATAPDLAWCCDPASPLGGPDADLAGLAKTSGAVLVLDRAYEPLRLSGRLAVAPSALARIWQLWTPNKALGLTGVRAAYAIAPQGEWAAVAGLERLCPSWPLGAHGVALLQAWTRPEVQQWLQNSLPVLREWKTQQTAMLRGLGWRCLPSDTNFFCAQTSAGGRQSDAGDHQSATTCDVLEGLRAHGIKLRDGGSFGMPDHVRLSVQPPTAQAALRQAWLAFDTLSVLASS